MRTMKILLAMVLIATQVQAAVVSNFIGREIPQSIVVSSTAASYTLGAVTFQDTGDTVTLSNHKLANGEAVTFGTITTTTGISINTTYYVVGATTNTFQVSATVGGAALPLTTNGTGILSSSYYAIVKAQVKNGGSLNLNGTTALASTTWNALGYGNGLYRTPGALAGNASGGTYPLGILIQTPMTSASSAAAVISGSINTSVGVNGWSGVDVYSSSTAMTSDIQEFKVPAGTVIVGSGDARYSIEIYKI